MDKLVYAVKNLTINDAEYYESKTATASDSQGNIKRNPETASRNSNIKPKQRLLSYRTIPVLPLTTNLVVYQGIAPIILALHMFLMPATKEVVADAASGRAWIKMTLRQVSRTGVDGSTPGNIFNAIGTVEPSSPVIIVIVGTFPPWRLNVSQEVEDKHQSTSLGLVRQYQKNGRYR